MKKLLSFTVFNKKRNIYKYRSKMFFINKFFYKWKEHSLKRKEFKNELMSYLDDEKRLEFTSKFFSKWIKYV